MQWSKCGFFDRLWKAGLAEYDELEGVAWEWQSVGGSMPKAPLAQEAVAPNPTDRGEMEAKNIFSQTGMASRCQSSRPAQTGMTCRNWRKSLRAGWLNPLRGRRKISAQTPDAAGKPAAKAIVEHGFIPNVRSRGEGKTEMREGCKPRRWAAEVARSWFNRFRKIHTRYEKTAVACCALPGLAAAMTTMDKAMKTYPAL